MNTRLKIRYTLEISNYDFIFEKSSILKMCMGASFMETVVALTPLSTNKLY